MKYGACKKMRYPDRVGALIALADTHSRGREGEWRIYRCHLCRGFHLSRQPQRTQPK